MSRTPICQALPGVIHPHGAWTLSLSPPCWIAACRGLNQRPNSSFRFVWCLLYAFVYWYFMESLVFKCGGRGYLILDAVLRFATYRVECNSVTLATVVLTVPEQNMHYNFTREMLNQCMGGRCYIPWPCCSLI